MYPSVEEITPPLSPSMEETETIPSVSPSIEETPSPTNCSICEDEDLSLSMFPFMEELKSPPNLSMEETRPSAPPLLATTLPGNPVMEETLPPQPIVPPPPMILLPPPPLIASGLVMGLPLMVPQRVDPTNNVARIQPRRHASWSTGLFDCHKDIDNCCMTCFCPCITFGQNAEIVDHGFSSCCGSGLLYSAIMFMTGCHCLLSCFYRSKMRGQFFLKESPCADCCVHCFCEPCALCQEYRELRHRGLDPQFGWHGNLVRQNALVPPSTISMTR